MMTCGECRCFKKAGPDKYIQGNGWCDVKLPHSMKHIMWGNANDPIRSDDKACSFGPLLKGLQDA